LAAACWLWEVRLLVRAAGPRVDPGGGGPVGVRGSVWVGVGEEPTKRLYCA